MIYNARTHTTGRQRRPRPGAFRGLIAACVLVCALPGCMTWYYCSKATITLRGSVVDAETGVPLSGVTVTGPHYDTLGETGEDGTFTTQFAHRWADKVGVIQRPARVDDPTPPFHLEFTKDAYASSTMDLPLENPAADGTYILDWGEIRLKRISLSASGPAHAIRALQPPLALRTGL